MVNREELINIPNCKTTETALEIAKDMTYKNWQDLGEWMAGLNKATPFWLGDWLNFGEGIYGEMYSQALGDTGLKYDTLAHISFTAYHVPPANRVPGLSFSHHRKVASLPRDQQKKWLLKAKEDNLSVTELVDLISNGTGKVKKKTCKICKKEYSGAEAVKVKVMAVCEGCCG